MGAFINLHKINGIYCGEAKIKTVYIGDKVIYKSDVIDPEYNYFVYQCKPNTGMHTVELADNRMGDETAWDGYTNWGDGTKDKLKTHTYDKPGIYTVKTKWKAGFEYMGAVLIGCDNLNINLTDASFLFSGHDMLKYADLSRLDTSKFTNMESMFKNCINLEELNIEGWDTSNVTNMRYMFYYCQKLTPIVSHFNVSRVTDFSNMFAGCKCLDGGQFSNWDTSSAEYMYCMFYGTTITNTLDMFYWNMRKVINMEYMCAYSRGYDGYVVGYGIGSYAKVTGAFYHNQCSYCINQEHHVRHGNVSSNIWQKMIKN
jgi:surface protein